MRANTEPSFRSSAELKSHQMLSPRLGITGLALTVPGSGWALKTAAYAVGAQTRRTPSLSKRRAHSSRTREVCVRAHRLLCCPAPQSVAVCSWRSGAVLQRFTGHQREVTKVSDNGLRGGSPLLLPVRNTEPGVMEQWFVTRRGLVVLPQREGLG